LGFPDRDRKLKIAKVNIETWLTDLYDKEKPPICYSCVYLLNTECNKTTESTCNSGEAEPVGHSQSHLILRVEKGWEK
jgi:hypothetical protein